MGIKQPFLPLLLLVACHVDTKDPDRAEPTQCDARPPEDNASTITVGKDHAAFVFGHGLGRSAVLDDLNQDGHADLLVTGTGQDYERGAFVFHGPFDRRLEIGGEAAELFGGNGPGYTSSYSIAVLGDVNDDGHTDLLVGSTGTAELEPAAGGAFLVHGPFTGRMDIDESSTRFLGVSSDQWVGSNVASAGDLNSDGHTDVLISSPGFENTGAVFVQYGPFKHRTTRMTPDTPVLIADGRSRRAGQSILGNRDFDSDGRPDIVMAAPRWSGSSPSLIYVVTEPPTQADKLYESDAMLIAEAGHVGAASSFAGVDHNDDGHTDLIVGTSSVRFNIAYVVNGPIQQQRHLAGSDAVIQGEVPDDHTARSVSAVASDAGTYVLVGAPERGQIGAVYVLRAPFAGCVSTAEAIYRITATSNQSRLGERAFAGTSDSGILALVTDWDGAYLFEL